MRRLPSAVTRALAAIEQAEAAAPIDLALARLLAGLDWEHGLAEGRAPDPDRALTLALTGALVSRARRDGHAAVSIEAHAGRAFPEDDHVRHSWGALPSLPDAPGWRHHLAASPVAGGPDEAVPLVVDGDRLAFRRFADAEGRVAGSVAARAVAARVQPEPTRAGGTPPHDRQPHTASPAAREAFPRLFPPREDGTLDLQALAAASALHQRVLLVAGGPGTGKTYTAARLLALVLAERPAARIALAAPTGKAATRLAESIAKTLPGLPDDLAAPVPTEATTLHRLLGAHPERAGTYFNARRPLPHDLVLVDEGSMIDLPLFDGLLAALRPEARLVVLGDPDQLAPVEAGTPFADLCAEGEGPAPPALAAFCAHLGLADVPASPDAPPLSASVVRLTESRRFGPDSGIGALAEAVRQSDGAGVLGALADEARGDVALHEDAREAIRWALPFAREVVGAQTPADALAALARFQILAAVRRGPRGVEGLNEAVEEALRREGRVRWNPYAEPFYRGRPVLVTVNDPETRLTNGDVGVLWESAAGRLAVFPGKDGPREVPIARLPAHQPAWALTIHKSQGSEFEHVGAVLPEPGTRGASLLTRELLYTATTRARQSVVLFGAKDQVEAASQTRQRRLGGLAEKLAEAMG